MKEGWQKASFLVLFCNLKSSSGFTLTPKIFWLCWATEHCKSGETITIVQLRRVLYKYYMRRNKMGKEDRISLCEKGMEITYLSFQTGMVVSLGLTWFLNSTSASWLMADNHHPSEGWRRVHCEGEGAPKSCPMWLVVFLYSLKKRTFMDFPGDPGLPS